MPMSSPAPSNVAPFCFSTKAGTLAALSGRLNCARLPPQRHFTVRQWSEGSDAILADLQSRFSSDQLVVRSSAINEDTANNSMAGQYASVLNVPRQSVDDIRAAVESVIAQYARVDGQANGDNEVLVQPQLMQASMSGVMFTCDLESGAPYLVVNYDDSTGKSDTVTSGTRSDALKIFYYFKHQDRLPSHPHLSRLIGLARELEAVTGNSRLDVEFLFKGDELYLLQLRPITSTGHADGAFADFRSHLEQIQEFVVENNRPQPNLYGYRTVYGVMPDWNPAEIIGICPKPLAFSLYRELITDKIWPQSRKRMGYVDVGHAPGIHSFSGKPYVDVRMSLNTFLPQGLSEFTAAKLVDFFIYKLINNPELHDKIEFDVAYTCFKCDFSREEQELRENQFTTRQILEIKDALLTLTNRVVHDQRVPVLEQLELTRSLDRRRARIVSSDIRPEVKIAQLVEDCKSYGTLPFSILARYAFIANIILKDLVRQGVITDAQYAQFFNSIKTVAAQFLEDLAAVKNDPAQKDAFLRAYGHLRPGTYDVSSKSYAEAFEDYLDLEHFDLGVQPFKPFEFDAETQDSIQNALMNAGFTFSAERFLAFAKDAIRGREEAKFHFTKNVNQILEYAVSCSDALGIPRDDVAFLTLEDLTRHAYQSKPPQRSALLKRIVQENKADYAYTRSIVLPPILHDERNVWYFHMLDNKPNYITQKSVAGDVAHIQPDRFDKDALEGKIVLIENADPGYDWIFSHPIKGLITKYGGVASHMSIRATEFNLPAAIGCGEAIFNYVKGSRSVELNCATQQIKRIL